MKKVNFAKKLPYAKQNKLGWDHYIGKLYENRVLVKLL